MPFTTISTLSLQPGKPITTDLLNAYYDRDEFLNGELGNVPSLGLNNFSFEVGGDGDTAITGWDVTLHAGGAAAITTSTASHGSKSLKVTHPGGAGNGGALVESDFFPITTNNGYTLFPEFSHDNGTTGLSTYANIHWSMKYYDRNQTLLSTELLRNTILSSIHPANQWNHPFGLDLFKLSPPSSSKFVKVLMNIGTTINDPGTVVNIFVDNVFLQKQTESVFLKTATATINGAISTVDPVVNIALARFSFFPNIYTRLGHVFLQSFSSAGDPLISNGQFALGPVGAASTFTIVYNHITNSEGYKDITFINENDTSKTMHYKFSNAPSDWLDIINSMKVANGFTTFTVSTQSATV